jgi:hypothetical protein
MGDHFKVNYHNIVPKKEEEEKEEEVNYHWKRVIQDAKSLRYYRD